MNTANILIARAFGSKVLTLLAFTLCPFLSYSQEVPTQKLTTSRIEHTTVQ